LSIFKARNIETRENKDSSPESCQIKIIDNPQNGVCRFILRLLCKHGTYSCKVEFDGKGVVKTHQLTYSPANNVYAVYDRDQCNQHFTIQSKVAKEYLDHFQSRIEELDICVDEDKLVWNGYTEGFTGDDNRIIPSFTS
jgi:cell cycle checkpoint control protein RAD9A